MPAARRGEIWLADLRMVAKVRPCLVLSVQPGPDDHPFDAGWSYDKHARVTIRGVGSSEILTDRCVRRTRRRDSSTSKTDSQTW
jgi:hypothetical protein